MADLLKIRAQNDKGLTWQFTDSSMKGYKINIDQPPTEKIDHGDVWHVELVETDKSTNSKREKIATVRLIARVKKLEAWNKIKELPDYFIHPSDLQTVLISLNTGEDVVLIGPKGTGKTMLSFSLTKALGWQDPYKVDVYTIKRTTDLFGNDSASNGSTRFIRSGLLNYIDRATVAHEQGFDSQFLIILDELNRVHAKINEALHGLFDDTRQITIPTADGSKTITLPPNMHTIATMNRGASYLGTHGVDEGLKDRFQAIELIGMPIDYEVKKLVNETGVSEKNALEIVKVATILREAAATGQLSYSPSYRGCRRAAKLVEGGMSLKMALIKGLFCWYEGEIVNESSGQVSVQANSERGKAFSALRMKGLVELKELIIK